MKSEFKFEIIPYDSFIKLCNLLTCNLLHLDLYFISRMHKLNKDL